MDERFFWLALNLVPGVGPITFKRLLNRFGSPKDVFNAPISSLQKVEGINKKTIKNIKDFDLDRHLKQEIILMKRYETDFITCNDRTYPQNLLNIYAPPPVLYVRGKINKDDKKSIAVVGSRRATPYGMMITKKLCSQIASLNITVVSGLARGIDTAAHQGALEANGRTIAVLGCGVDIIYPHENKKIFFQIIENGAIISEFPMSTKPEAFNFPRRNRIISGLSLGTVVVEAGKKSGALITAQFALQQGRDVFAVPGKVTSLASSGTNYLIKQGAYLVEDAYDIINEISPMAEVKKEIFSNIKSEPTFKNENEKKIYDLLGSEPIHIDNIISSSHLSPSIVMGILLNLELQGSIVQYPGKMFARND